MMEYRVRVGFVFRVLFLIAVVTSFRLPQQNVRRTTMRMASVMDDIRVINLMNAVQEKLAARLQAQEMNAARIAAREPIVVDPNNVFNQMFSSLTSFKVDVNDLNPVTLMEQFIHNSEKIVNTAFLEQIITTLQASEQGQFLGYCIGLFALTATLSTVGKLMSRNAIDEMDAEENNIFGEERIDPSSLQEGFPYGERGTYNAALAAAYFSKRPFKVLSRGLEIASSATIFGLLLLFDFLTGQLTAPKREAYRADQLTTILTRTGPTFIKVGQSLSIRTDLLRPAYIIGLTKLQDKVPPFPTAVARRIIEEELGQPVESIFSSGVESTASVVAAASLGQVFKAKLRSDGSDVAVKIQRPAILENVALDMHLLREVFTPLKVIFQLNTDLIGLIDEWGTGFVDELNYYKEANNADEFMASIANTPLKDAVFAPAVIRSASTGRVLTTRWVDGEKLDTCTSSDVTTLCSVAMNTYLTMMLEKGMKLHADPHPGNLKRTPDGRLCILDWGLVTQIGPDLQMDYIQHIAHLTSR